VAKNEVARVHTQKRTFKEVGAQIIAGLQKNGSKTLCEKYIDHCLKIWKTAKADMDRGEEVADQVLIDDEPVGREEQSFVWDVNLIQPYIEQQSQGGQSEVERGTEE
jgi:hypothetical protein